MSYLVRKINKRKNLDILEGLIDIEEISADIPTSEFRTTDSSLSTWYIDSLQTLDEAVLAIAVSSSDITKMDFIVIQTDILDSNELQYTPTYAGMKIAIPDLQDKHYDIQGISLKKLKNCCKVYKDVIQMNDGEEIYIVRYAEGEIKDLIREALIQQRVDINNAKGKVRDTILKLM